MYEQCYNPPLGSRDDFAQLFDLESRELALGADSAELSYCALLNISRVRILQLVEARTNTLVSWEPTHVPADPPLPTC